MHINLKTLCRQAFCSIMALAAAHIKEGLFCIGQIFASRCPWRNWSKVPIFCIWLRLTGFILKIIPI
jgi:hypothetical protein